jgi:hypothetical protein
MATREASPEVLTEAIVLREAGFTLLAISDRTKVSVRTLQRHFARHGAKKGCIKPAMLEQARAELLTCITSNDEIRSLAASFIRDDIAHANSLRSILMRASEHMKADSLADAVLVRRAAAAYSTAIKNTSDTVRRALGVDRAADDVMSTALPTLVLREITDEDACLMGVAASEQVTHT